ncbi:MAG TPA: hypothetical protein VEQ15_11180 [Myxococcales bacterium]|jgi:hypothetical protein|nr:hypothetical protein [Myxococcales bacterium]
MDRGTRLDDDTLLAAFESTRMAPGDLRHAEHVRLAFLYLARQADFGEAAVRFRRDLRRFAAAHGVMDRYHETLTWAYLALINERAHGASFANSAEFLRRHPEVLDQDAGLLSRYYDVAAIARSARAKEVFVLPELDAGRREP